MNRNINIDLNNKMFKANINKDLFYMIKNINIKNTF